MGKSMSIEDIQKDYYLEKLFGNAESEAYKKFLNYINTPEGITKHPADLFDGVKEVFDRLNKDGIKIILISARHIRTKDETKKELDKNGLKDKYSSIHLANKLLNNAEEIANYKRREVKQILKTNKVIAYIGDRLSDFKAAKTFKIPTISFNNHQENLKDFDNPSGHFNSKNWIDIYGTIKQLIDGNKEIENLRLKLIDQYASWLSDIDHKARLNATIGLGLAGLSGTIIKQGLNFNSCAGIISSIAITIGLFTSLIAIIFALRASTSRRTSGINAKEKIGAKFRHGLNTLNSSFFKDDNFLGDNDPIIQYDELKNEPEWKQKNKHYSYFQEGYKTYDKDALLNLRLYALRAANYAKLYPERFSAQWLEFSIISVTIWLFVSLI